MKNTFCLVCKILRVMLCQCNLDIYVMGNACFLTADYSNTKSRDILTPLI